MTTPSSESPAATTPPKPVARWEDFVDIFYAPAAVFQRRENQSVWPPLLIVTAIGTLVSFATFNPLQPLYDADIQRGIAKQMQANPQMTQDMANTAMHAGEFIVRSLGLFTPISILLVGFGLWVVGKIVGSRQTFHGAMVVSSYTLFFLTLEGLANGAQALVMDVSKVPSVFALQVGPARFFDPVATSPLLFTVLLRLNVFVIWRTVLLAIGVRVTGKVSWPSAAVVAVLIWVLATALQFRNVIAMH